MAQAGNSQKATQEEAEKKRRQRNAALLKQLKNGELTGRVIVILLLGSTGSGKSNFLKLITGEDIPIGESLASGTVHTWCLLTNIGKQLYLFLDTPGFGHPDLAFDVVKEAIYTILGNFTRCLGGVHGILYFHDITTVRTTSGMQQSFQFLKDLTPKNVHRIIFITTKWDLVVPKQKPNCERLETELKERWFRYRIDQPNCARYLRFGASCEDEEEEKKISRNEVVTHLTDKFCGTHPYSLEMPFLQWTWGEIITAPIWYPIKSIGTAYQEGRISFSVSVDL